MYQPHTGLLINIYKPDQIKSNLIFNFFLLSSTFLFFSLSLQEALYTIYLFRLSKLITPEILNPYPFIYDLLTSDKKILNLRLPPLVTSTSALQSTTCSLSVFHKQAHTYSCIQFLALKINCHFCFHTTLIHSK